MFTARYEMNLCAGMCLNCDRGQRNSILSTFLEKEESVFSEHDTICCVCVCVCVCGWVCGWVCARMSACIPI